MKRSKTSLAVMVSVILASVGAALAYAGAALADIPPPRLAQATNPLEGRWLWKSSKSDCTETHEYMANGTALVQSGQEALEQSYTISKIRGVSAPDQYLVVQTITKTNGKPDCAGSLSKLGNTYNIYFITDNNDSYLTCGSGDKSTCYGSAQRAK